MFCILVLKQIQFFWGNEKDCLILANIILIMESNSTGFNTSSVHLGSLILNDSVASNMRL